MARGSGRWVSRYALRAGDLRLSFDLALGVPELRQDGLEVHMREKPGMLSHKRREHSRFLCRLAAVFLLAACRCPSPLRP